MTNYDTALARAIDRDLIDEERLEHFALVVGTAIDGLFHELHPLGHPRARWHPADLMDCLQEHLRNIQAEQANLRGPLFIDEDDE